MFVETGRVKVVSKLEAQLYMGKLSNSAMVVRSGTLRVTVSSSPASISPSSSACQRAVSLPLLSVLKTGAKASGPSSIYPPP